MAIFILFGVIAFREMEKISDLHMLVEKHGSAALTVLETVRKNVLDIRALEGHLIAAKTEKSIDNNAGSIIDTYKTASRDIQLFKNYSRNAQKEESTEKILNYLDGLKKFSDEIISLKLHPPASIEDINAILKDGEKKFDQLQDAIDDTLKLEYNTVFENFKNAAGLFENLKYKLLSLFIVLTAMSIIITYLMILYFSKTFNELDTRLETEKVKAKLMDLFDGQYDTADAERLLYTVSKGLGAHASRLFEKKQSAHSNAVGYEKIGTYINAESKMDVHDINAFHDFKFFLGNTSVVNEFVLYDLEAMNGKLDLAKEAVSAVRVDFIDYIKKYEIKTFLACPLMKGNNHKYLMSFYFKEDITCFTEERIKRILELVGSVAVYLDNKDLINEMAKKNELLNTQNNELEAFAHTVSHDLKTPLSGLMGFLELSKSELSKIDAEKKNAKLWDYLDTETKSAMKMDSLINDILALSKANNAALKIEKLDMKNVIDTNLRLQESLIQENNITVNVQNDIPNIEADLGSISRVWNNLISNSIKYMGDGEHKEISISYAKVGGEHIFIYSDTGIGISRRYQSNIFTPFFRTHEAKSAEGTGVGLSIVKKIIERHSGTITFESAAGEGTTFYIRIPEDLSALKTSKFGERNGNHK